ncbi:MAG: hypothetical protein HC916_07010 [Coleofasciculaceae cyanobacterium SM2_1_6]|nr:hypothetical protein [Coleofasciculaceae cyanobacterium SM2_1_6]
MTNPKNGSTLAPWQLISIGAGSVVILGLAGFGAWNLFAPKNNTSQSSPASQSQDAIQNKLIGQWQVEKVGSSSFDKVSLIFAVDNKFYVIQDGRAEEGTYLVMNAISNPQKVVLKLPGQNDIVMNLVNEKYLTFLSDSSMSAQKTSDTGVLPEGVKIAALNPPVQKSEQSVQKFEQSNARHNISAFNRAFQASYLEKGEFTSNFADLGVVGVPTENENYKYTIDVIDRKQMVRVIATSKQEGLKSYLGIVSLVKINNQSATQSIACESLQPTTAIPPKPSNAGRGTSTPTCLMAIRILIIRS